MRPFVRRERAQGEIYNSDIRTHSSTHSRNIPTAGEQSIKITRRTSIRYRRARLISRRKRRLIYIKTEPTNRDNSQVCRLCVFASDSLITGIFSSFILTSVSCLHLGQYKGKVISSVSSRIFNRVLFLHAGHITHSVVFICLFSDFGKIT